MEDKYRNHIKQNVERLIRETEYRRLMEECRKRNLLTYQMCKNIEQDAITCDEKDEERIEFEKHNRLFLKITKRGPDAFEALKRILNSLKMYKAERILSELDESDDDQFISISKSSKRGIRNSLDDLRKIEDRRSINPPLPSQLKEETIPDGEIDETTTAQPTFEIIKSKAIMEDTKNGTYPMVKKHNRGILFMVNIIDFPAKEDRRDGAEKDGEALSYLFKQFGFKTYPYKNLKKADFQTKLTTVLESKESEKTECFVMALMTHGTSDGTSGEMVSFSDGTYMTVHDIKDMFKDSNCPNLKGKPKIFIFPFCRGDKTDIAAGPREQAESLSYKPQTTVFGLKDVLICYASSHGFKAHRDPEHGNWYIQDFCELMGKHAHDTDIERIVKQVGGKIGSKLTEGGGLQTCCFENIGFNALLYFNPGVWTVDDSDEDT